MDEYCLACAAITSHRRIHGSWHSSCSSNALTRGLRVHKNIIVRLVAYYFTITLFVAGLFRMFPTLGDHISRERERQGGRASLQLNSLAEGIPATAGPAGIARLLDPEKSVPILFSTVLALLVSLPVVWVYRWTRSRSRYSQGFAHTLLVVPIAITLVVFLANRSLALAFSLAGIVMAEPAGGAEEPADRFNARLRMHAVDAQVAQGAVVPYLGSRVKKWRLAGITPQADGTSLIEFELRIRKSADLEAFIRAIEAGDPRASRVELRRSAK